MTGDNDNWVRVDNAGRYGRGGLLPDVGLPHRELAGPANQPCEARILGSAPRAWRGHPAAARQWCRNCRTTKRNRICRFATCWRKHRENPVCASCHARFDVFGLAFEGYGPGGRSADQRSCRTARRRQGHFPGRQRRLPDSKACRPTSASIARTISWTISAANCCPMRLNRSLLLSDEPLDRADAEPGWPPMVIALVRWWKPSSPALSS